MIKFSAPGSAMLMGEHAVLRGYPALVFALNRRIVAELEPREDNQIFIETALANYVTTINEFEVNDKISFVTEAVSEFTHAIPAGFNLKISSDIKSDRGYGSSAASLAVTLAVLLKYSGREINAAEVYSQGIKIIRKIQGRGSGADLAASIYGGLLEFISEPFKVKKIDFSFNFFLDYCGFKTPTAEVIKYVDQQEQASPLKFKQIFAKIADAVCKGSVAAKNKCPEDFYKAVRDNQALMEEMGLANQEIKLLLHKHAQNEAVKAVKISGSGLGDSVVCIVSDCYNNAESGAFTIETIGLKEISDDY